MDMDHNFDENQVFLPIAMVRYNDLPILLFVGFGTVAYISVILRTITRAHIIKKFGWDDATMIVSLLLFTVFCIGFVKVHLIVVGKNSLTVRQWKKSLVWLLVTEQFYTITIVVLKISLGIFFHRAMVRKWHKWVVYITVAFSTIFGIAYFFFSIFQCGLFKTVMEFGMRKLVNKCVSPTAAMTMGYVGGIVATLTDFIFASLPILVLRHTKMERREKITVFFILAFAAIGSIASLIRLKYVRLLGAPNIEFYRMGLGLGSWSLTELALGIIAASLATLRPLFRKFLTPIRSMRISNRSHKSRDSNDGYSPSIRKSRIGNPKAFGAGDTSTTVLWLKVDFEDNPDTPASFSEEWDRATLIEGEAREPKWAKDEFGVLSPLPRITPYRGRGDREVVRHYEMTPVRVKPDRRNSSPG